MQMLQTFLGKYTWQVKGQENKWNGDARVEWEGKNMCTCEQERDSFDYGQPCS